MKFARSSGVLAHPTSFPSKYGIGDLGQGAIEFIDFLYKGKQFLWQVLPVNPTSFGDSPYQSFSTFAGQPLLIAPDILIEEGFLDDDDISIPEFDDRKIDYGSVITYKFSLLKKSYEHFKERASKEVLAELEAFCEEHAAWLDDYCLFVALKDYFIAERKYSYETPEYKAFAEANAKHLTKNQINDYFYGAVWNSWPKDIASRKASAVSKWQKKLSDEISFYKYLQFQFFKQWKNIKTYANSFNVSIIGDIPIFVAMDSADVWSNKKLFMLDKDNYPTCVAGVPPDYFSKTGQLWGNPLYNWKKHEATGYEWWLNRVSHTLTLVDIVRIDHFRGFESYWSIPYGEPTALNGKWVKGPGKSLFEKIEAELGSLPIIAEDLGIITEEVTQLREELGLPGMHVIQFGFDAGKNNTNLPHNFETPNVAVYSGTHDNNTTLGWYKSLEPKVQDQFRRYMNVSGETCSWDMIRLTFLSTGVIAVVPIQDVMSLDEEDRMNTPGIPSGNWQFRFTSDMLKDSMAEGLKYLAKLSDRNILDTDDEELDEEDDELDNEETNETDNEIDEDNIETNNENKEEL